MSCVSPRCSPATRPHSASGMQPISPPHTNGLIIPAEAQQPCLQHHDMVLQHWYCRTETLQWHNTNATASRAEVMVGAARTQGADLRSDQGYLQGRCPPQAHWPAALVMCLCCAAAIVHLLDNLSKNSNALVCLACVTITATRSCVYGRRDQAGMFELLLKQTGTSCCSYYC